MKRSEAGKMPAERRPAVTGEDAAGLPVGVRFDDTLAAGAALSGLCAVCSPNSLNPHLRDNPLISPA